MVKSFVIIHPCITNMLIDLNSLNTVFVGLLTIIGFFIKMDLHDTKNRIRRIEDAFIQAGSQSLINKE